MNIEFKMFYLNMPKWYRSDSEFGLDCIIPDIKEFTCEIEFLNGVLCYAKSLQSCPTLGDPVGCSLFDSSVQGDSVGRNTGVGCHALLQGIFPTQGLNLRL